MCGNGIREGGEQCDGTQFWNNQNSCQQYNGIIYSGGTLGCNNDCTYDASNCALSANCGNGNLDQGEGCDDGNLENGDGCSAACVIESACGNGVLNLAEGCDDGNSVDGDGCSSICTTESFCGNGVVNQGEQCDDGNTADDDSCSSVCETQVAPPPPPENPENPPEEDLFTVTGTKIILKDFPTVNDSFATKVEATETFNTEIIIYTVLYGPNNKVLSIKSEKVENGLSEGQTYTATVQYPQTNVKSKSILVFDVEQDPSVFGQLQKSYE
jgi:cysteine-rich repeat protein